MRKLSSILTIFLVLCLTVGGVSAAWVYAAGEVVDIFKEIGITMPEWDFGYTVSFINNGELLLKDNPEYKDKNPIHWQPGTELVIMKNTGTGITNVLNDVAMYAAMEAAEEMGSGYIFSHWINAGSTRIDSIPADNTEDIVLYPSFVGIYTAMFVDQKGNIMELGEGKTAWANFTTNDVSAVMAIAAQLTDDNLSNGEVPEPEHLTFSHWEVVTVDDKNTPDDTTDDVITREKLTDSYLKSIQKDVTISPIYDYDGDVSIVPVDTNGDGVSDYYHVDGFGNGVGQYAVEIPAEINGLPTTGIVNGALSTYDDIHAVVIPADVAYIGSSAFADGKVIKEWPWGGTYETTGRETVTLYFEGDPANWLAFMNKLYNQSEFNHQDKYVELNNGISVTGLDGNPYGITHTAVEGSFASDWDNHMGDGSRVFFMTNGMVDLTKGYWELQETTYGSLLNRKTGFIWVYYGGTVPNSLVTEYTGECDCGKCGSIRPDAYLWLTTTQ